MTKRRASTRGGEREIVFGEPSGVSSDPDLPGVAEAEGAAPWEGSDPDLGDADDELARALYREARDGAPPAGGVLARSLPWEDGVLSSPEVEAAMMEEAFAAEEPSEPEPELPVLPTEAGMEEPSETGDASSSVLPSKLPRAAGDLYLDAPSALDIQKPETEVKPIELPGANLSEEERQAVLGWWGDSRIEDLSRAIDALYEDVRRKVGENETLSTEAYNLLLKARDILIRRDAERIAQAEYYIEQVQLRLKRAAASEAAARKAQWPLLAWGLVWGGAFLTVLILSGMDRFQVLFRPAGEAQSLVELDIFLSAMLWGGVGGAVAVLYSLFKHIGMRDFDKQYVISYVGKPFMGLIVGATVYMIVALVVRALGIGSAGQAVTEVETAPAIAPGVIYLVAWAAGFKENHLLSLVDRAMKQVIGSAKETTKAGAGTS